MKEQYKKMLPSVQEKSLGLSMDIHPPELGENTHLSGHAVCGCANPIRQTYTGKGRIAVRSLKYEIDFCSLFCQSQT